MRSNEIYVSQDSNYYVYTPSALAKKLYFYPICVGLFHYESGYHLQRSSFDSFLIMHVISGTCDITLESHTYPANTGDFVILNCYKAHQYKYSVDSKVLWLHYDGPMAKTYFEEIYRNFGPILSPRNATVCYQLLEHIYQLFHKGISIHESSISLHITDLLNELLLTKAVNRMNSYPSDVIAAVMAYINEHFHMELSLEDLAIRSNLSMYHFSRRFAKETGFTPHQYLLVTRMSAAKYLLKTSKKSIKEIAFNTGFHSESSFCSAFKKYEQQTPSEYRSTSLK